MVTLSKVATPSTKNGADGCAGQRPAEFEADKRQHSPGPPSQSSDKAGKAVIVLAVLGVIAGLYFGRPILVPIVVSLLLAFLFAPIVTGLTRVGMPRWLGSAVVVLGLLYFLLSWGHLFKLKLGRVLSTKEERRNAWRLARTVQQDISTYLLTVTGINSR